MATLPRNKRYDFVQGEPRGLDRLRLHATRQCRFAATLLGYALIRMETTAQSTWYSSCTCFVCGKRLNDPSVKVDHE